MSQPIIRHLTPAFADPVHDSQACFRHLLDAMARPGQRHTLPTDCQFGTLSPAASQVLLTLADQDTPLWLAPSLHQPEVIDNLRFHLGSPLTNDVASAALAVLDLPALASLVWPVARDSALPFPGGNEASPETGCTLIIDCPRLDEGPTLRLAGPGLRAPLLSQLGALPQNLLHWLYSDWRAHHFPCGIDLILCAGQQLVALPRTTRVQEL